MKIQCEYCGSYINDTDEVCKNCGGINENLKRVANGVPTTIEELKLFCRAHNLPLAKMRFYIGENYKLPKAFGIYKDEASGEFIVYKNKSDGSRAIRYQGDDEAYAVHEIYLKLKEEIQNQKAHQNAARQNASRQNTARQYTGYTTNRSTSRRNNGKSSILSSLLRIVLISIFAPILLEIIVFASVWFLDENRPDTGYYQYQNDYYYYYDDDWYIYDSGTSNWLETTIDDTLEDNYDSYFSSYSYDSSYDAYDFTDSSYYEEPDYSSDDDGSSSSWDDDDWDDDWDSDYDWDSGSDWDSSYTDWDSDW